MPKECVPNKTATMKQSFFTVSFLYSLSIFACSCLPGYQSLTDNICSLADAGGVVFEMRLNRTTSEGAFFTVESVLTGQLNQAEIFMFAGNDANCGLPVNNYAINSRYLCFSSSSIDSTAVTYSYECGPDRNIYELDGNSTQIRYMTPPDPLTGFPGMLAWQSYPDLLEDISCALINEVQTTGNPLLAVRLVGNPGNGMIQFFAPGNSFPVIETVRVFDISGRLVLADTFDSFVFDHTYDLTKLPTGIYSVVIGNHKWRRGLKYVKVR